MHACVYVLPVWRIHTDTHTCTEGTYRHTYLYGGYIHIYTHTYTEGTYIHTYLYGGHIHTHMYGGQIDAEPY